MSASEGKADLAEPTNASFMSTRLSLATNPLQGQTHIKRVPAAGGSAQLDLRTMAFEWACG
jgi:hypothetical protein